MPLVLVPVLFAVVIFGRLAHTRIVLDAAAAAGARQAAVAGADTPAVGERIATELRDGGPRSGPGLGQRLARVAAWGEPIRVRLAIGEQREHPVPRAPGRSRSRSEFVTRSEVTH